LLSAEARSNSQGDEKQKELELSLRVKRHE